MENKFECLLHLTPGYNDDLFESNKSSGGYIKLFGYGDSQETFLATVKKVIGEYGSNIVSVDELKVSEACFEDYPYYKGIYLSPLHTYNV